MAGPAISTHSALSIARAPQSAAPRRTLDGSRTFDHILQASRQRSRVRTTRAERPQQTQPSPADEIERQRRSQSEAAAPESPDTTAVAADALIAAPPAAQTNGANDDVGGAAPAEVSEAADSEAVDTDDGANVAAQRGADSNVVSSAVPGAGATTVLNGSDAAAGDNDGASIPRTETAVVDGGASDSATRISFVDPQLFADGVTADAAESATDSAREPAPAVRRSDARGIADSTPASAPIDNANQNSDEAALVAKPSVRPVAATAAATGAAPPVQATATGSRRSTGRGIDRGVGVQGQRDSQRDVQQVTRQSIDGEGAPAPSGRPLVISRPGPFAPTAPATNFAATVLDAPSAEADDGRDESASTPDQNTRVNPAPAGGTDGATLSAGAASQAEPAAPLPRVEGSASVADARLAAIANASDAPVSLDRLGQTVRAHIDARQWHVQIQLDPPELGRVQLDVAMKHDALQVRMQVASEQVRRLVEARLPELVQALGDRDMQVAPPTVVVRSASAEGHGAAGDPQREPAGGQPGGDRGGAAHGQERSGFGAPREQWRDEDSGGRAGWNPRTNAATGGSPDPWTAAALDRLDLVA